MKQRKPTHYTISPEQLLRGDETPEQVRNAGKRDLSRLIPLAPASGFGGQSHQRPIKGPSVRSR